MTIDINTIKANVARINKIQKARFVTSPCLKCAIKDTCETRSKMVLFGHNIEECIMSADGVRVTTDQIGNVIKTGYRSCFFEEELPNCATFRENRTCAECLADPCPLDI